MRLLTLLLVPVLLGVPSAHAVVRVDVAKASASPRPNLEVTQGSLRVRHGRQQGSFIVVDSGYVGAAASTARLTARIDSRLRVIATYRIPALVTGGAERVAIDMPFVRGRRPGRVRAIVCVDVRREVRESSERDNCHDMGRLQVLGPPQREPDPTHARA